MQPALFALCVGPALGCSGSTAPASVSTMTYALRSINGAALPAVYFARNDSTGRVFADTLHFRPATPRSGDFGTSTTVGITVPGAAERTIREVQARRGTYAMQNSGVDIGTFGGSFRMGAPPGADSLVLVNEVRQQVWLYWRVQ
jgi:hypothetical protein